ncbi:MAG: DUF6056 family protein [Eubacteriales bacterium]|nr:DUF6056 family protein [Eubacteriales bacterium]
MNRFLSGKRARMAAALLTLLFLVAQMALIPIAHDDYGYATLDYVYEEPNVQGQNFSAGQLIHYLYEHYELWGGRVLAFGLEIATLRLGVWPMRLLIAAAIWGVLMLGCKMADPDASGRYGWLLPLAALAAYGCMERISLEGIYWFTGAAVYLLPAAALFLAAWLLYRQLMQKEFTLGIRQIPLWVGLLVLSFYCGWSVENMGGASVLCFALLGAYSLFKTGWDWKKLVFCASIVAAAAVGFLFLMAAPGNATRMALHEAYYAMPLLARVGASLKSIPCVLFTAKNWLFTLFVGGVGLLLCAFLWKTWRAAAMKIVTVLTAAADGLLLAGFALKGVPTVLVSIAAWCYLLGVSVLVFAWLWKAERRYDPLLLVLWLSACASQAAFGLSPEYPLRAAVFFALLCVLLVLRLFAQMTQEAAQRKKAKAWVLPALTAVLFAGGMLWQGFGFHAYYLNAQVHAYNDLAMRTAGEHYQQTGKAAESIVLMRVKDRSFSHWQACDRDLIKDWQKRYYNLPQSWGYEDFIYVDYDAAELDKMKEALRQQIRG